VLDALREPNALRSGRVFELGSRPPVGEIGLINLCVLGSVWLTIDSRPRGSALLEKGVETLAGSLKSWRKLWKERFGVILWSSRFLGLRRGKEPSAGAILLAEPGMGGCKMMMDLFETQSAIRGGYK
jgi:hypothetical protein